MEDRPPNLFSLMKDQQRILTYCAGNITTDEPTQFLRRRGDDREFIDTLVVAYAAIKVPFEEHSIPNEWNDRPYANIEEQGHQNAEQWLEERARIALAVRGIMQDCAYIAGVKGSTAMTHGGNSRTDGILILTLIGTGLVPKEEQEVPKGKITEA